MEVTLEKYLSLGVRRKAPKHELRFAFYHRKAYKRLGTHKRKNPNDVLFRIFEKKTILNSDELIL